MGQNVFQVRKDRDSSVMSPDEYSASHLLFLHVFGTLAVAGLESPDVNDVLLFDPRG